MADSIQQQQVPPPPQPQQQQQLTQHSPDDPHHHHQQQQPQQQPQPQQQQHHHQQQQQDLQQQQQQFHDELNHAAVNAVNVGGVSVNDPTAAMHHGMPPMPSASQDPRGTKRPRGNPGDDDDDDDEKGSRERRKIEIKFIEDKSRRHITFSKRKAGIMKKAYELSVLTGTQVLLLVVSETGLVYTFTTRKLQPLVTKPEGKNLIQACLNAPEPTGDPTLDLDVPEAMQPPPLPEDPSLAGLGRPPIPPGVPNPAGTPQQLPPQVQPQQPQPQQQQAPQPQQQQQPPQQQAAPAQQATAAAGGMSYLTSEQQQMAYYQSLHQQQQAAQAQAQAQAQAAAHAQAQAQAQAQAHQQQQQQGQHPGAGQQGQQGAQNQYGGLVGGMQRHQGTA
ncbi:MADS box protein [Ascosphaera apis ARSEF 7405]|uniref:MADS box protein n=1 Tax=Ascosphaera apis ARSEF 7405 TaxID=392613 RepID=A0A168CAI2_9EURO|nr:MADS box protein [Ascosphaera apis ARSEF 7405]